MLGACDRQSEAPAQQRDDASAPSGGEEAGVAGKNGTLDIESKGEPMPDIVIGTPDGGTVGLTSFKGKPLLVNLWATWCGPCVAEMPTLDELAEREGSELKVLTVSQDVQGLEVAGPWFDEKGFRNLEAYTDSENQLMFHYGTGVLPTTVLYDADGKEVWRMIGSMEWTNARAELLIQEAMGR